jgi:hypothetical protein
MIYVEYCEDGINYSDFNIIETVKNLVSDAYYNKKGDTTFKCSTDNFILATRLLISQNIFDCDYINFVFEGIPTLVNQLGELESYPKYDYRRDILKELLIKKN